MILLEQAACKAVPLTFYTQLTYGLTQDESGG